MQTLALIALEQHLLNPNVLSAKFLYSGAIVISQKFLLASFVVAVVACGQSAQTGGGAQRPNTEDQEKDKNKPGSSSQNKKPKDKSGSNSQDTDDKLGSASNSVPQTSSSPAISTSASVGSSTNPGISSIPTVPTQSSDPNVVVFRIKAGTGRGPWNDASNPIRIRVGQTLEVHNDDSIQHWIHTDFGQFMTHPFSGINPGQSARYQIGNANARGLHDHNTGGAIVMEITQ